MQTGFFSLFLLSLKEKKKNRVEPGRVYVTPLFKVILAYPLCSYPPGRLPGSTRFYPVLPSAYPLFYPVQSLMGSAFPKILPGLPGQKGFLYKVSKTH